MQEIEMASELRILRADQVLELDRPDEISGFELVDGRPVPVTPASPLHGSLAARITYLLLGHVERAGLGGRVYCDAGFVLGLLRDPERMRAPDISYVAQEKVEAHEDPERLFRCVPNLAIEVDLTSGRKEGGQRRILDYLEAGVPLVWAIDPLTRTAMVYRPDGSARLLRGMDSLDGEDVLPGFTVPLSELYR